MIGREKGALRKSRPGETRKEKKEKEIDKMLLERWKDKESGYLIIVATWATVIDSNI